MSVKLEKLNEVIIAIETDKLPGIGEGIVDSPEIIEEVTQAFTDHLGVALRGLVETDESRQQPIPYVALTRSSTNEIFCYRRLSGGGDKRIENKFSVGVGGHMNPLPGTVVDNDQRVDFTKLILENTYRELDEELRFISREDGEDVMIEDLLKGDLEVIALVNDSSTPVSRVHIGFIAVIDLDKMADVDVFVGVREVDVLEGDFVGLDRLQELDKEGQLEEWSSHLYKTLYKVGE